MCTCIQEFEKTKSGADKQTGTDGSLAQSKPRPFDQTAMSALTMTTIPMAPPPALANPDKPVSRRKPCRPDQTTLDHCLLLLPVGSHGDATGSHEHNLCCYETGSVWW